MSASIDDVRAEIARRLTPDGDGENGWAWVREMFVDRAIVEVETPDDPMMLFEVTWQLDGDDIEQLQLSEPAEVTLEYVAKAEGGPRLAGPIVRKDAARRIAYSAVLVPGEPDSDGEILTAEKVEDVAHAWLEQFRAFDVQHSVKQVDVSPVESYIEPADRTVEIDGEDVVLPAGTWTLAAKFHDDAVWDEVAAGTRTGLSIMGVPSDQLEAALAAVKSGGAPAYKRVTLADVGGGDANGDWFAPFIGIVDQPAVPKAKFYAFKAAPQRHGLARRLRSALASTPAAAKEGRRFSDQTYRRLKEVEEAVTALIAEADEEREDRADKAHDHKESQMDRDEVATIVSEAVPGALKSALGDALEETVAEAIRKHFASSAEGGGDGDDGGDATKSADDIPAAVKEALEHLTSKVEDLASKQRAGSRQPDDAAPDGAAVKSLSADYDAFGRRVRK